MLEPFPFRLSKKRRANAFPGIFDCSFLFFFFFFFVFFPLAEVPGYAVFTHSWLSNHVPPPTAVGSGGGENPTTPLSNIGGDLSVIPGKGGTGEHYFGMK